MKNGSEFKTSKTLDESENKYLEINRDLFIKTNKKGSLSVLNKIDDLFDKFKNSDKLKDVLFEIFKYSAGFLALITMIGGVIQAIIMSGVGGSISFIQYLAYEQIFSYGLISTILATLIYILHKLIKNYVFNTTIKVVFITALERNLLIHKGHLVVIAIMSLLSVFFLIGLSFLNNFSEYLSFNIYRIISINLCIITFLLVLNDTAREFEKYFKIDNEINKKKRKLRKIRIFRYLSIILLIYISVITFDSTINIFKNSNAMYNEVALKCVNKYYQGYSMVKIRYHNSNYMFIEIKGGNELEVIAIKIDDSKYCM